jgi:signal transduction histidine kinase
MGFDEQPTIEQIKLARERLVLILASYLVVSIIILILLSTRLIRPLRNLQHASRQIAKGHYDEQLRVDSQLSEIRELASDLESMRVELVGINDSLRQEIAEKEAADKRREELESELRLTQKLETVGVLAGGIAHEFNNILLPIFLYTEQAIHDAPPGSNIQKHLEQVLKSARRAKVLLQQILTFSRQPGRQVFKQVDVKHIVEEAFEFLRALMPSSVELRKELVEDDCLIMADRDQIHQLVMNLCSNAYKALDDSVGTITVTLDHFIVDDDFPRDCRHLQVGKYIRISVHDTGRGIDHDYIERIFEPFFTTRSVGEGTGLGLSVAHGIAMSHKGALTVESQTGKGTTFFIYLPEIVLGRELSLSDDSKQYEIRQ